jgi:hypothetical protein
VSEVHDYLSEIGRRGGRKSKGRLTSEEARALVQKRWAKKKGAEASAKSRREGQLDIEKGAA